MKTILFSISILALILSACKKDTFITSPDASISVSVDTLHYDTVFTSTGSVTQFFKIFNDNDQKLRISNIRLMGGNTSSFKINADGFAGPEVNNLDIEAKDSLYVFVSVSINQNTNNIPFIVRDSIQISFNGNKEFVQLEAWGQNAHFYRNRRITTLETWANDLPYVILGSLVIDPNATLTINKGCRIFVHADAPLVVDGTLKVNGEKDSINRVYFRGDRLDEPYNDFPAGWPGIYFRSTSQNNVMNYAVIKNAYQAIILEDPAPNAVPKLMLNQCIIDNAYDAGILAVNSGVRAVNCLISNCGQNLYLVKGGDYQFIHCTVVSYSNNYIPHKNPVLFVSNFVTINNVPVPLRLDALFRNCIFWGENGLVDDEVIVAKNGNTTFNVNFDYGLYKVKTAPLNSTVTQMANNKPPLFDSINTSKKFYDFRLQPGSPALNTGTNAGITIDLDGKSRPVGVPDLGCYERR